MIWKKKTIWIKRSGKVGDDSISWCVDNANLTDVENECARHLLSMTEEERASALARYDEYVTCDT